MKLLEDILLENPQKGDVIEGTSGARKMRIQMNGHGKRGGGRVIYVDIFEKEKLYFLFAYPKNVQVNLTEQQKKIVRQMVEAIKGE
ncbi:MAG: type II toxin-antitoxin system RelE/ParE family toxin [Eubacteriales bacterium]|uniref:type II toxin-antitoxin system RelE/ParE family toxin n=1 Tax=Agathobaculum sp. TaxID=2048138 RepID=UPI002EA2CA0F|nr:type II toxin-antitoxin system RelE/ParE family toxin [Eubacteriales bacterium]